MKNYYLPLLKSLFTCAVLFTTTAQLHAQCLPNPIHTTPGVYPDTVTGLAGALIGVPYNEVLTIVVPLDTSITQPVPMTLTYDSIVLDSVSLMVNGGTVSLASAGLSYQCSPNSCSFPANTSACVLISGTPTINLGPADDIVLHLNHYVNSPVGPINQAEPISRPFSIPANIDVITGTVYEDLNGNCQQDIGENGIPGKIVSASPGSSYTMTDASGFYTLTPHATGTHTISLNVPQYWVNDCPAPNGTHSVNITTQNLTIANKDFGPTSIPNVNDLQVVLTNQNPARPGFMLNYKVDVKNVGTNPATGTVSLTHDALLNFNVGTPAQTSYSSNTIVWDYGTLAPGQQVQYTANFTVSQSAVLGDSLYSHATANPISGDTVPADNVDTLAQVIQGSYDPNDKAVVPDGNISPEQVAAHQPLTYKIRFQNTGTDTAFTVVVRDTLSPNLNIETFEVLSTSHACITEMNGPGNLAFTFNNILLPDSNVNEPASHGYIKYRIQPKSSLVLGDEIHNTAAIYFDFNAPVITNTTVTEVAIPDGIHEPGVNLPVNIYPNPTSEVLNIVLLDETKTGNIELSMTNVSGQVIKQLPLNQARLSISVSDLPAGFYFISLTENDEVRDTRKVIITKH